MSAGDRHLGAAVDVEVGRDLFRQFCDADVLDDDRVATRSGDAQDRFFGLPDFVIEDQCVKRDETFNPTLMKGFDNLGELF